MTTEQQRINRLSGMRIDFDPNNRRVASTDVIFNGKEYWVSTVDLGIDYSFGDEYPVYWETMIFDKPEAGATPRSLYCDRYASKEEAESMHNRIVKSFELDNASLRSGYFEFDFSKGDEK